ncbi:MAG: hypothetical protein QME92_04485 [Bacillota bacterium]|nr:hypothetical protein [Bacillota bacterium]
MSKRLVEGDPPRRLAGCRPINFVSLPDESWIEADDHLYVLDFRQMTTLLHKTGFRPVLLWEDRYMALVDRCFLARKVREP